MAPLFSIITVTYNAAESLRRTIESVESQTCPLYEHIVMDGASKDGTADIIKSHEDERLKFVSGQDDGVYDAMNKAISMATGDYLIFMNAGDTFHSADTLQHLADSILDNDYPGIVYGQTNLVNEKGEYLGPRHLSAPENLTLKSLRNGMVVCHQAMAVLRRIAPLYNMKYKYSSDYEWLIICLQHSKQNVYVGEVVCDYLSTGITTQHHKESLRERYKIMCTYFGTIPTLFRHAGFAIRYMLRRGKSVNNQ